jgi:hypothetical protein
MRPSPSHPGRNVPCCLPISDIFRLRKERANRRSESGLKIRSSSSLTSCCLGITPNIGDKKNKNDRDTLNMVSTGPRVTRNGNNRISSAEAKCQMPCLRKPSEFRFHSQLFSEMERFLALHFGRNLSPSSQQPSSL